MRNAMPRGASVQRATQSMKSRIAGRSGGQSRLAVIDLRLPPSPSRTAQTTPVEARVPSGAETKSPGARMRSVGTL